MAGQEMAKFRLTDGTLVDGIAQCSTDGPAVTPCLLLETLLTKRPGHLATCWPRRWNKYTPKNVWVGTTAEDQACAEERVPELIQINAREHFVSCEPLAGEVDLKPWLYVPTRCEACGSGDAYYDTNPDNLPTEGVCLMGVPHTGEPGAIRCRECDSRDVTELSPLSWVIGGGESGPGHEPLDLSWLESLHQQAAEAGVPFFCKQDSGQHPGMQGRIADHVWNTKQFPLRGEVVHAE